MSGRADRSLADEVRDRLRMVIDPELGENVVDLGLIYDVTVESGMARVTITTTMRGCPAAGYLREAVQSAASTVPGIRDAAVCLTYEPAWSPEMMNETAKRHIGMA